MAFYLPNLEGGGAERAVARLSNSVADSGNYSVDLVLSNATGPYISEVSDSVRIVNLSTEGKVHAISRLVGYLKSNAPQVIMSALDISNIQLIIAAKLAKFKGRIAISQRATIGPVYAELSLAKRLIYYAGIKIAYPHADVIICNSLEAAAEIRKIRGVNADKVVAIYNAVDVKLINQLAKEPVHSDFLSKGDGPLVLSVGGLTPLKDRATLVKAFSIVKAKMQARFVILGEGPERGKIEGLLEDMQLTEDCYLAGFDSNPYKWMRNAAVIVSSSMTEGCPNNLLEGLALSKPIVATNCPGDTAELLQHGRWGRLVPVGNADQMAKAILEVLNNPQGSDGHIRAADFAPSKITNAYLNVLLPKYEHAEVVV